MCEASAALQFPCGAGNCLIVGDNEVCNALYLYPIENQDLDTRSQTELPLGNNIEISDIESLVSLGANRVLILGSHSRNEVCEPRSERRRFLVVEQTETGFKPVGETVQAEKITCNRVLGDARGASDILKAVCVSIDDAERRADAIFSKVEAAEEAKKACDEAAPFNGVHAR